MIKPLAALYFAEIKESPETISWTLCDYQKIYFREAKKTRGYGVHICFYGTQPVFPWKQKQTLARDHP